MTEQVFTILDVDYDLLLKQIKVIDEILRDSELIFIAVPDVKIEKLEGVAVLLGNIHDLLDCNCDSRCICDCPDTNVTWLDKETVKEVCKFCNKQVGEIYKPKVL